MREDQRSKRVPEGGRRTVGQGVVVRRMRGEGLSWDQGQIGHEGQEGEQRVIGRRAKSLSVVETWQRLLPDEHSAQSLLLCLPSQQGCRVQGDETPS